MRIGRKGYYTKKMKKWPEGGMALVTSQSKSFDFQHGYQMWTWFVNFLDKKAKIKF